MRVGKHPDVALMHSMLVSQLFGGPELTDPTVYHTAGPGVMGKHGINFWVSTLNPPAGYVQHTSKPKYFRWYPPVIV